jgi:DNA-binding CsgD family transcriptional regulator/N-acetylneuraminic acid mutarotase
VPETDPSTLSKRELQVLEMVATGASNQQIARHLVISVNTVKVHLRNIFEKLGVQSRTEAILKAIQEGWISVADDAAVDAAPAPKTFLLNSGPALVLEAWQQIYLAAALLLALAVLVLPLLPRAAPRLSPNLPVIYAQPATPVPAAGPSTVWHAQPPMPTKRAGLAAATFSGRVFAIGGVRGNNQATRLVEIFDPAAGSWSEGAAKPTATANILGIVFNDKIYVPGGCTNQGQAVDLLEIYAPATDAWTDGPALPAPRCGYALALRGHTLYLFGGWDGRAFTDTIFAFDLTANKWAVLESRLPQAMGYAGAATLQESIYVAGGYNGQTEFNQTYIFNPDTGAWTEKASLNQKRGGLGLISAANNLYALGGGWNQTVTSSEKYDPAANTWATFDAPYAHQWRNMGVAIVDTKIYAVGGWDAAEARFVDTVSTHQFLFQLFLPISSFTQ